MKTICRFCVLLSLCVPLFPESVAGAETSSPVRFTFHGVMEARGGGDGEVRCLNDPLLVRALIIAGADVHESMTFRARGPGGGKVTDEMSPLFFTETPEVTRVLVEAGVDVNLRDGYGNSALFYTDGARIAAVLISAGADVNSRNDEWTTPIFAARNGDVAEVLLKAGAVMEPLLSGQNPLHTAQDAKTVQLLVTVGADVNARAGLSGLTPLCTVRGAEAVKALLEAGADARVKTENGMSALHFWHEPEAVRALIAAGADVNAICRGNGRTPLHFWVEKKAFSENFANDDAIIMPSAFTDDPAACEDLQEMQAEVVRMLLAAGADANAVNVWNETPLMRAAYPAVTRALLVAGADANLHSKRGITALHMARDAETMQTLLAAGANVHALTLENISPLHTAANEACVEMLLAAGANPLQKDDHGRMPLWYARNAPCAKRLINAMTAAGEKPEVFLNEIAETGGNLVSTNLLYRRLDQDRKAFEVEMNAHIRPGRLLDKKTWAAFIREKENCSAREIMRVLLAAGADVNAYDAAGQGMVFYAWTNETLEMLGKYGAVLACEDNEHETPLMQALYMGAELEVVKRMLDAGMEVNALTEYNHTALNRVMRYDYINRVYRDVTPYVKLLLEAGADPNLKTEERSSASVSPGLPPLHYYRDAETVRLLLTAGADPNLKSLDGRTPIFYWVDQPERMRLLLEAGARVDVTDKLGYQPLHSRALHPRCVEMLIRAGADVNAKSRDGATPLFYTEGNAERVKLLLMAGADVSEKDTTGETVLFTPRMTLPAMDVLLAAGADVDARNVQGYTPLMKMTYRGDDLKKIKRLVVAGARLDVKNNAGATLLHLAKTPEIMAFLLEKGLDVNARDDAGNTPLMLAGDLRCAELLLKAGADVNAKNRDGENVMHRQAQKELFHQIAFYLAWGGDINAKDRRGRTPLFFVHGDESMFQLLRAGADAKIRDETGGNVLFRESGMSPRILRELIRYGAEVNVVNAELKTPLHIHANFLPPVQVLVEAGADVNARDLNGETPLFFVADRETYDYLVKAGANPHAVNNAGESPDPWDEESRGWDEDDEIEWGLGSFFDDVTYEPPLQVRNFLDVSRPCLRWDLRLKRFLIRNKAPVAIRSDEWRVR